MSNLPVVRTAPHATTALKADRLASYAEPRSGEVQAVGVGPHDKLGLLVDWNLLYGFPGDRLEEYHDMLALVPLLRHLSPPVGPGRVSIPRYSASVLMELGVGSHEAAAVVPS